MVTFEEIKKNKEIKTYVKRADDVLGVLGYTDHSAGHTLIVSRTAAQILETLGYSEKEIELVKIAGYIHDIGNMINRRDHAQIGAAIAFQLLRELQMDHNDIATITGAIGNHDEDAGIPVSPVSAALIIADKQDVRRSRVRNRDFTSFDIHDRVNYSVEASKLIISPESKRIYLKMTIDTEICSVMDYFEIFLSRMIMCKRAAEFLDTNFGLEVNEIKLL